MAFLSLSVDCQGNSVLPDQLVLKAVCPSAAAQLAEFCSIPLAEAASFLETTDGTVTALIVARRAAHSSLQAAADLYFASVAAPHSGGQPASACDDIPSNLQTLLREQGNVSAVRLHAVYQDRFGCKPSNAKLDAALQREVQVGRCELAYNWAAAPGDPPVMCVPVASSGTKQFTAGWTASCCTWQ